MIYNMNIKDIKNINIFFMNNLFSLLYTNYEVRVLCRRHALVLHLPYYLPQTTAVFLHEVFICYNVFTLKRVVRGLRPLHPIFFRA